MIEKSYDFDPCILDGSDQDEDEKEQISLDTWKPSEKIKKVPISQWRQQQIGENHNQDPDVDDLKKINYYLKQKFSDSEIMNAFGINAETLVAIKNNRYCPMEGIDSDNLSKIQNKFASLEKKIIYILRGIDYLSNILLINKKDKELFLIHCKNKSPKIIKTVKNNKKTPQNVD